MTAPVIHVHVSVDKATTGYADFTWRTMLSLANRPELLKLTIHSMGPTAAERLKDLPQATMSQANSSDNLNGSLGHAVCIMDALSRTGDDNIHVIADSDTVVVARGWDDYVRLRIVNTGVGMMGTTYEDIDGFSSGNSNVQTYKKVPTFTWAALSPKHDWRRLDVMPNKAMEITINTEKLSKLYNLPIGYRLFGEAAWQVPGFLHDNGISFDAWPQLKPTKTAVVLQGLTDYHEEYHVEGVPFVVHHRGSMRHAYRGSRISKAFYEKVDRYLASEAALSQPRWTWTPEGTTTEPIPVPMQPTPTDVLPEQPLQIVGDEWLKLTFNGAVIRKKTALNRVNVPVKVDFARPSPTNISVIRVEGVLAKRCSMQLPGTTSEPYVVAFRNASRVPFTVMADGPNTIIVPASTAWWVLVDVDGVHRVE